LLPADLRGLRVLDAGCGTGWLSRYLAGRGALVVGVDISEGLVARARSIEAATPLGITYDVHDLLEALPYAAESFDVAISAMTVMDVEDPLAAVRHIARIVRPGGQFVFSLVHPCFYRPKAQLTEWGTEFDLAHYFDRQRIEGRSIASPDGTRVDYRQFHRTLGDYLNALAEAGFCLQRLVEPGDSQLAISARKHAASGHSTG
jgi:2-polyprenyl-3-methyl-5-hydroxy-6-metoxy-1,4-benzoquinol methylase